MIQRIFNHLFLGHLRMRRYFNLKTRREISSIIKQSETLHSAQVVVAIEARLSIPKLLKKLSSHRRAKNLFSDLKVWDTANNNGILIYSLLADRKIDIICDRGIMKLPGAEQVINETLHKISEKFKNEEILAGIKDGLTCLAPLLATHFPPAQKQPNELPDKTVIV